MMLPLHTLPSRQRGAFNLYWVAIASVVFAAVAMAALMSIRSERNLFAEGVDKLGKTVTDSPAGAVIDSARQAARGEQGTLRKCTINGKVVVSNADCAATNPTSREIKVVVTRGVEAPKKPPEPPKAVSATPLTDKMIEKVIE
jgi:hypothetical protein